VDASSAQRRHRPGWSRYHAITTPRVFLCPTASRSVAYRVRAVGCAAPSEPSETVGVALLFAAFALALPIRFERTTLALGKPCSIQLSYGSV
jgi:hypothetical protein